jgi:type VI secretion system secreted protein VgrG
MALGGGSSTQVLSITTTLGDDAFLAIRMSGQERLGRLPEFVVDVVGDVDMMGKPKDVDLHKLMGTRANVTMEVQEVKRHFNSYIVKAERGDRHGRYQGFTLTMRPWLWFLTRTKNYRVFQEKSVKDIIEAIITDYSGKKEFRLNATYPKLDYCVQYNETDFDFVSRLMEGAGMYYFFEHTDSDHTMVIIDKMMSHKSKKAEGPINWATDMKYESTIVDWRSQEDTRSVKAVVADHDYLATATKIEANKAAAKPGEKLGTMEIYEYPANVVQNGVKDAAQPATTAATDRAGVLIEELTSMQTMASGTTNERDVAVGATFKLEKAPWSGDNADYLVVAARYEIEFAQHEAVQDLKGVARRRHGFEATLIAIKKSTGIFRAERSTPRPMAAGPETALVVGASGNEIETDKHGRVKVQFFWDRLGKNDQNSSCWLRVATPWAGKGFGAFALPRVGHEVVVSFLGGNPDRPLVTGSVYNDVNMPAWEMPKHKTVSGVKTQSTKDGTADTNNEFRFEDEKGKEYIWLQAEKDFYRHVKNDAFDLIDKNETVRVTEIRKAEVGKSQFVDIGEDSQTHVAKDVHLDVGGDQIVKIAGANQLQVGKAMDSKVGGALGYDVTGKIAIKSGDAVAITGTGKISLKSSADVLASGINVHLKGSGTIVLEAPGGITLKCGGSLVNLSAGGVDIVGAMVKINSGGGGGSATAAEAASPGSPADPKKPEALKVEIFKDPMTK